MPKDLRSYLDELIAARPNAVMVVDDEVDPEFEAAAIVHRMKNDPEFPGFPAVLFRNVKGSPMPMLMNLHATFDRIALSIETDVHGMVPEFAKREGNATAPREVTREEAPVQEVILRDDEIDLTKLLPLQMHQELDAGKYITSAAAFARDPDSGRVNAGIYRHQLQGPRQIGFMSNPAHHAAYILRSRRERGERMEVALAIGHHPAMLMGAVSQLAGIGGETEAIGGLLGEPLDVVKAVSVDLMVPARAEIVIEGFIDTDPEKVQQEGPFGEYPLYYTGSGPQPYIQVTAVSMRRDPIYVDVFNSHDEHLVLGAVPRMGSIYRRVKAVVPSVTAVNLPLMGIRSALFISIKKRVEGEPKMAAVTALSVDPILKHVWLVDDDIDVYDNDQVLWAMTTRFQADRDMIVMPNFVGGHLNPVTYGWHREEKGPMETKVIFDCTKPAPPIPFPPRCEVPRAVVERVDPASVVKPLEPGTRFGG
jgi:2,5-furandicarboxylate decarboxylase 1